MSIHTDRAFYKARGNGAAAARDLATWDELMGFSKRELAEIAMHLAALCTDSYDDALQGDGAIERIRDERDSLKLSGII